MPLEHTRLMVGKRSLSILEISLGVELQLSTAGLTFVNSLNIMLDYLTALILIPFIARAIEKWWRGK